MDPALVLVLVAALVVIQRLAELRLARRNELWARARGAVEHGAGHYPAFFVLHGGWLVGWTLEAWFRGPALATWWPAWLAVFVLAQGLRGWAMASLGRRWTTRILVLPGRPLVRSGPYAYVRHPNYVAVTLELAAVPLIFGAWVAALAATLANAVLLYGIRIPAEERALER